MSIADTSQILTSLRQNFLFASLEDVELEALADHVHLETKDAGETIVRENDKGDSLYVVMSGGVNVVKANGHFLAFLGPRGFFGEMGLFTEYSVRTANCVADQDCAFLVVKKDALDVFCAQHPRSGLKIYKNIIRTLSERLQATSADLAMLMQSQVKGQSSVADMVEAAKKKKKKPQTP